MKSIQVSIQEINEAMKPSVHRNKKKYRRNNKHKLKSFRDEASRGIIG